jgi:Zn-dependent protease with chaperone function
MTLASPSDVAATPRGPAVFFDGQTSARNDVVIEATAIGLSIMAPDGRAIGEWPYAELRRLAATEGLLRLRRRGDPSLARLEVRDTALADAIEDRAVTLDRSGAAERALRRKVVGFSVAAVVSLIATAVIGVPVLTTRLLPLVPVSVERKLGNAVDKEIRSSLDTQHLGTAFACGKAPSEIPGRVALDKMVGKLAEAAALPVPLNVEVVRRNIANAFALPGGKIYVFEGLIAQADTPDEIAGVLAHEMGHVAHRDGARIALQAAGLSFLFGMMLGDFVGGGAVVIAAKTVLRSSYSRQVEAAADAYSVALMNRLGADPHALGVILARLSADDKGGEGLTLLRDHPETKDRITAINAVAITRTPVPLIDAADFAALKHICAPLPAKGGVKQNNTGKGNASGGATPNP